MIATSLSQAAEHIYKKFGKTWRKYVALKSGPRRAERAKSRQVTDEQKRRDAPWPFSLPDNEKLASLHDDGQPGLFQRRACKLKATQ